MMNLPYPFFAEPSALQPNRIDSVSMCVTRGHGLGKRQYIFRDGCAAAHKCMCSDANEMMHWAERPNLRPIFDDHVSAKRRCIGQNHVIANHAIMSNMRISHHQHIAANFGKSSAFDSPAVDGDE